MNTFIHFFIHSKPPLVYVKTILIFLVVLTSFHAIIWNFFTKDLLSPPSSFYAGDLSRLSYQPFSLDLRKINENNLSKKHISSDNWNGEVAEVVTIGDSFSNGVAFGPNAYYQDYISSIYNINTLNIKTFKKDPPFIPIILSLLKNDTLKKMKTKMIIIESVERLTVNRLIHNYDWDKTISTDYLFQKTSLQKKNQIRFINNGNYKFIYNTILYSLIQHPFKRSFVYQATLTEKLFSVQDPYSLLFFYKDIKNIKYSTHENIQKLNNNLNTLATILDTHGIVLAFMPAVDKYNLYSPYIKENDLPKSRFFERLETQEKKYYFVNTKAILRQLLPQTKDLYYADDTHWSNLASKHIISNIPVNTLIK